MQACFGGLGARFPLRKRVLFSSLTGCSSDTIESGVSDDAPGRAGTHFGKTKGREGLGRAGVASGFETRRRRRRRRKRRRKWLDCFVS